MELSKYKKSFRIAPILVNYMDDDGKEQKSTLMVKYKPLTREWFNSYEQTQKKIEKLKQDGLSFAERLGEEEIKLVELEQQLSVIEHEDEQNTALKLQEIEAQRKIVEKEKASFDLFLEEASNTQKTLMATQLLPVLIDFDLTEDGKPIPITLEFLNSLDYELLLDVGETIGKKTFRHKTT